MFGFDDLHLGTVDSGAALDAISTGAATCMSREPPGPPAADAGAGGGDLDLVFATSISNFGFYNDDAGNPLYKTTGFDLDFTCTSTGQPPSCVEQPWTQGVDHKDGVGGVDNAFGALASTEDRRVLMLAQVMADKGSNVLFRVRGYSGGADDARVSFAVYVGTKVVGRDRPLRDGNDQWFIHQDTLVPGDGGTLDVNRPRFEDDQAYVSGWVLVAHLPEVLAGPGHDLAPDRLDHFVKLVLTARLVRADAGALWELRDGDWGARMPINDALSSMGFNTGSTPGVPNCQVKTDYEPAKAILCSYEDISSEADNTSSACDALSVGGSFEAEQALVGPPADPPQPSPNCAPGIDPQTDTCNVSVDP
jgi:hypothetical protein